MNFRDLKAAVNAAALHDLAETSAEGVCVEAGSLLIEFDTSAERNEIAELKDERDGFEKMLIEAEEKAEKLETELEKAKEALTEIKDPATGTTLATFLERAEDAEAEADRARDNAREWQKLRDEAQAECRALRKRKGIASGIVRHHHELWVLLGYITQSNASDWTRYKEDVRKMLEKINAP